MKDGRLSGEEYRPPFDDIFNVSLPVRIRNMGGLLGPRLPVHRAEWAGSGAVGVAAVADGVDLDLMLGFVDPVDVSRDDQVADTIGSQYGDASDVINHTGTAPQFIRQGDPMPTAAGYMRLSREKGVLCAG